jgi:serine/threonine protein kinase
MEWLRGKCIGKGAFGTVHLAVDTATGRAFAVKSVDSKSAPAAAMACLESEIRILRRLSSPHVVAYLGDDGATATTRNLHMELVPGGSATEAARGGLAERGARGVLRSVAAALRYLHEEAGVVHGDVKGRNVLLGCRDGDAAQCCGAKLADFGAARLVSDAAPARGPRGTPAWMAPEVARGGAATPASDVWALGCTALELLTGSRPWSELGGAADVGELLLLVGFGGQRPAIPAWLPDACRDFLDKCLRRDAGQRWSCAQLLRHPFLSADAGETWPSPSPRAVLDWAPSDSDSESMSSAEAESMHEVMARAKGRLAELASNGPRTSWDWDWDVVEWGSGPTRAADTWAPPPSYEAQRNGDASAPVPSTAAFSGGRDRDVLVLGSGSGSGLPCGHGRPGYHSHCCRYKCGFGRVGRPLLAAVGRCTCASTMYCCSLCPLNSIKIYATSSSQRALHALLFAFFLDRVAGHDRLISGQRRRVSTQQHMLISSVRAN